MHSDDFASDASAQPVLLSHLASLLERTPAISDPDPVDVNDLGLTPVLGSREGTSMPPALNSVCQSVFNSSA